MQEYKLKLYLEKELSRDLSQLNTQRKKLATRTVCIFVFLGLPLVIYILKFLLFVFGIHITIPFVYEGEYSAHLFVGMFILFVVLPIILIKPNVSDYRKQYKARIIKALIKKFVHPSLKYLPGEGVSEEVFNRTGFYPLADQYTSEDKVTGKIGTTAIELSEITADEDNSSEGDILSSGTFRNLFNGLLFSATFDKQFDAETYVLMKSDKKHLIYKNTCEWLSNGARQLSYECVKAADWRLVTIEDTEFNKIFKVYSKDHVDTRHMLPKTFTKRMVDFQKRLDSTIKVSFVKNRFFITINTVRFNEGPIWFTYLFQQKSILEPKIFGRLIDYNKLEKHINNFKIMIDMIEILNDIPE